jgi:hypothetical protein
MAAALRTALRRTVGVVVRSAATRAPLAAVPALEAVPLPLRHALGGRCAQQAATREPQLVVAQLTLGCVRSVRGFASRGRSPRDVSRAMEALRRKREAAAAAEEAQAASSTTPQAPPPLSEDVQRAATAAGGSLTPHAATAVEFTPVRAQRTRPTLLAAQTPDEAARPNLRPLLRRCSAARR